MMNHQSGQENLLVAVVGIDGAGKSTLCDLLQERFLKSMGEGSVQRVSVLKGLLSSGLVQSKEELFSFAADHSHQSRLDLMCYGLNHSMNLALKSGAKCIISDGYWYKYIASEILYGLNRKVAHSASEKLRSPDLTFSLQCSPEESWSRKNEKVSRYESGLYGMKTAPQKQNFISFQSSLEDELQKISNRVGKWMSVPTEGAFEQSLKTCSAIIEDRLIN